MLWSGSSPSTVRRGSMWGFLMFTGAAWLAISWSVLRLEPIDIAAVAGPIVLFGAVGELLRAIAGTRTWWLNACLTVLFAATGGLLMWDIQDSTYTTPAALIGWYLMVRGAVDIAVGIMTRGADRTWSLLVTIGVLQTGLGFWSASSFARTGPMVIVVLGALGTLRAIADLVTALRLREVAGPRKDVLELPPERAAGVSGYAAGLTDFEGAPSRSRARHRARPAGTATPAGATPPTGESFHDQVVRTTADLDAMLAQAGITGPRAGAVVESPKDIPAVPDTPEGVEGEVERPGRQA
ncbi:hypothetical protein SAMN05421541_102336 [Actinoplanes philippinensis]|uniref:DUF308 domain-containing protein n=2 Tax=Actinoplanes philippinensis TaxID=35752 RepID=A0A1I2BKI9_9ACTN|nr:hypothetical protein [Actinoplanes philippinensis]SFE55750.1 hypothetical protein SAMN05421541_102336 [Actinoplanes philippinensis]